MEGGEIAPMLSARAAVALVAAMAAPDARAAPLCRKKRRWSNPLPATGSPNCSARLRALAMAPSRGFAAKFHISLSAKPGATPCEGAGIEWISRCGQLQVREIVGKPFEEFHLLGP